MFMEDICFVFSFSVFLKFSGRQLVLHCHDNVCPQD